MFYLIVIVVSCREKGMKVLRSEGVNAGLETETRAQAEKPLQHPVA